MGLFLIAPVTLHTRLRGAATEFSVHAGEPENCYALFLPAFSVPDRPWLSTRFQLKHEVV